VVEEGGDAKRRIQEDAKRLVEATAMTDNLFNSEGNNDGEIWRTQLFARMKSLQESRPTAGLAQSQRIILMLLNQFSVLLPLILRVQDQAAAEGTRHPRRIPSRFGRRSLERLLMRPR